MNYGYTNTIQKTSLMHPDLMHTYKEEEPVNQLLLREQSGGIQVQQ